MHITARRGSQLAKAVAAAKPFTIMIDGKVYRVTASPVAEANAQTPTTRDIDGRPVVG